MNRTLFAVCFVLACAVILQAQTPTITAVYGEAGTTSPLCPGGIAFVQGTNLGGNGTAVTVGTRLPITGHTAETLAVAGRDAVLALLPEHADRGGRRLLARQLTRLF